jgi:3-hydroxyacyl-[acyl-carrier-protein] dehydratase
MTDFSKQLDFKINDILKVLPHRYPFILIDKLEVTDPGKSLVAIKNITINEPFFQGHFPGMPVMPGVLSLEIMAQAGAFLMLSQVEDPLSKNMLFSAIEKAKFRKPIVPGDQLKVNMDLVKRKLNLCKFHGKCFVDDILVAEAFLSANIVPRPEV